MRHRHPLVAFAGLALLSSTVAAPAIAAEPTARFAWPRAGQVEVTEIISRPAGSSKIRYVLELAAPPKRGADAGKAAAAHLSDPSHPSHASHASHLIVRYGEVTVLAANGKKPTKAEAKRIKRLSSALPDVIVGASGQGLDIAGVDRVVDRLAKFLSANGDVKQATVLRQMAKDPKTIAAFKQSALQVWRSWVGVWRDVGPPGQPVERTETLALLPGTSPVTAPVRLINEGADSAGVSTLIYEVEVTPERAPEAARRLAAEVAGKTGTAADGVKSVRAVLRYEARVHLDSLRPVEVRTVRKMDVDLGEKGRHVDLESHTYRFAWRGSGK